uniref:Uncharacterized protein n=1 Tax=Acrobeloides nanus TaxID=290746 RepID=A0A914CZA0_9BILA
MDYPSSSEQQQQQQQQQQPINIGYYMAGGYYNAGFVPPGYEGQSTFLDNYSAHYYGGAETTYGGPSGAYRAYPQPQPSPPYRRSRTAPVRTLPRAPAYTRYKGARGYSVPPPEPLDYRKRRPQQRPQPAYQ